MNRIVLISCVSEKLDTRSKAEDLYVSLLFRLSLSYARQLRPNSIFILSAKYGLVPLTEEIDPYNLTLKDMSSRQVREWADRVLDQLRSYTDIQHDPFIFLAGEKYRKYLIQQMRSFEVPMERLRIGEQLQFLKRRLNECSS